MDARGVPLLERIGNAVVSYVIYLRQMIFPAGLATPYPNPPNGQPIGDVCLALVALAAITAGVVAFRKKRPYLLTGWLWYLGMAFPVIGIIQISADAAHADRYTYVPGIGLALAATWAVADASAGWRHQRLALGGLMIAAIGALTIRGHIQTSYWRDEESLWTHTLACTSNNRVALNNMGNLLLKQGKLDEAIARYRKALDIKPDYADALNNLGTALSAKENLEEAIVQFRKALEITPDSAVACYNLASALARNGNLQEAIAQYRKALEINPDFMDARYYLCKALLLTGDLDAAMTCFEKKAALSPDLPASWRDFGNDFLLKEDWALAIICYQQAIKINPRYADAWAALGMACSKNGRSRDAIDAWQKSLEINPDQFYVQNDLAWLLATASDPSLRNGAQAVALATKASQWSGGGNPAVLRTLAAAYAEQASYGPAAATARRALELAARQKQDALAATLENEMKLYLANTPLRNAPR